MTDTSPIVDSNVDITHKSPNGTVDINPQVHGEHNITLDNIPPKVDEESNYSKKLKLLKHFFHKYGDFTIFYADKRTDALWPKWKKYSECTPRELEEANLRELMPDEVMFDIETPEGYKEFLDKVKETGIKLNSLWKSGSKGYHATATFSELKQCSESHRVAIREAIIREYKTDPAKKNGLIALEYAPHFKTGNIKSVIEKFEEGDNKVPIIIPEEEETKIKQTGTDPTIQKIKSKIKISDLLRKYKTENVPNRNKGNCACPLGHPSEGKICFSFDDMRGVGHCFHCGFGGDIISLRAKKENLSFVEVKEKFCEELKIDINKVVIPGNDKLISEFASEVVHFIDGNTLFNKPDLKAIVEVEKIECEGQQPYIGFVTVKPNRFITIIEKYMTPGINIRNKETNKAYFHKKSIGSELANTLLSSEIIQHGLPQITRLFNVPMPIIRNGVVTFPKEGYDERFQSWLTYGAPKIDEGMTLEDAKSTIDFMLREFCFKTPKDKTNAIAAIITPFLRGLYSSFSVRTPVFMYIANRERSGKDYLAAIRMLIYDGIAIDEAPLNSGKETNPDELRKKLLSALISGKRYMHFANNKGFLDNAVFEQIITSPTYEDRVLGKSEMLQFQNEMEFSLSGNSGITFSADLANRSKIIELMLDIEDANARKFETPNLHQWILDNRGKVLSAIYILVKNWNEKGRPKGIVPFASFTEWADICAGIMTAAEYDNPCIKDKELFVGGDTQTIEMKQLYERVYALYPDQYITRTQIKKVAQPDSGDENSMYENHLFPYLNLSGGDMSSQVKFGNLLTRFIGRILSDIKLEVENEDVRGTLQKYRFSKVIVTKPISI